MKRSTDDRHSSPAQSQSSWAGAEFLYRFEASLLPPRMDLLPEGLRMGLPFEGKVVGGAFEGRRVRGLKSLLLRDDGVGVLDMYQRIEGPDGEVTGHVQGYCLPPDGVELPPLEEFLRLDFEWPTALFPVIGFSTFAGATGDLAWLNRGLAEVAGWASLATGRLAVETRIVNARPSVQGPAQRIADSNAAA